MLYHPQEVPVADSKETALVQALKGNGLLDQVDKMMFLSAQHEQKLRDMTYWHIWKHRNST